MGLVDLVRGEEVVVVVMVVVIMVVLVVMVVVTVVIMVVAVCVCVLEGTCLGLLSIFMCVICSSFPTK